MSDINEDNPASNEAADNVNESLDINNELENAANEDVSNGQGSTNGDQETQSETQENERPSPPGLNSNFFQLLGGDLKS